MSHLIPYPMVVITADTRSEWFSSLNRKQDLFFAKRAVHIGIRGAHSRAISLRLE